MKNKNSLHISKRNKRGIFIFLIVALVVVFIPRIILAFAEKETFDISFEEIQQMKAEQKNRSSHKSFSKYKNRKERFTAPPCMFDPNKYNEKDWMKIGLSPKQAAIVIKFTERGIYSNDQLQKIFVISDELFELIKDSTFYPKNQSYQKENSTYFKEKKSQILININIANQEEMESIPGVGSFYAKNILKQRERLGGFYKKEQLLEVWKMDIEKYNAIEPYILIDLNGIRQIKINEVSSEVLKSHPYFNWSIANSLVKMRSQKGAFKRIDEIKESVLIDEELFEKIKPYISL